MSKVELIRLAIEKSQDPDEIKKLNDELITAIREEEAAKLKAEQDAEAKKLADDEAIKARHGAMSGIPQKVAAPQIEVVSNEEAYGFNLKRAVAGFKSSRRLGATSKEMGDEAVEKVAAHFAMIYARAGLTPDGIDPVRARQAMAVQKAVMVEGTSALGGYVVPTVPSAEILAYMRDYSVALQECRSVQMNREKMSFPAELAKVSVGITAEATAATGTSATLAQVTLDTVKIDGSVSLTAELLADNFVQGGIIAWLTEQFMEAHGQAIDSCVFIDDGVAALASGVFKSYGYSQVFAATSTNFSALLWTDIPGAIAKVPHYHISDGHKWYINHAVLWGYFNKLVDTQNRPLFLPTLTEKGPSTLFGYQIRTPSYATSATAAGGVMAIFTNLAKQYIIGHRLDNMALFLNPYVKGPHVTEATLMTRFAFANALPNYAVAIKSAAS